MGKADRAQSPSNAAGEAVTINLHGVDYDAASDTVIVTDVGSADDNTDGHIYAIRCKHGGRQRDGFAPHHRTGIAFGQPG